MPTELDYPDIDYPDQLEPPAPNALQRACHLTARKVYYLLRRYHLIRYEQFVGARNYDPTTVSTVTIGSRRYHVKVQVVWEAIITLNIGYHSHQFAARSWQRHALDRLKARLIKSVGFALLNWAQGVYADDHNYPDFDMPLEM